MSSRVKLFSYLLFDTHCKSFLKESECCFFFLWINMTDNMFMAYFPLLLRIYIKDFFFLRHTWLMDSNRIFVFFWFLKTGFLYISLLSWNSLCRCSMASNSDIPLPLPSKCSDWRCVPPQLIPCGRFKPAIQKYLVWDSVCLWDILRDVTRGKKNN